MAEDAGIAQKIKKPDSLIKDILKGSLSETIFDGILSTLDEFLVVGALGIDIGDWIASMLLFLRHRRKAGIFVAFFGAWEAANFFPINLIPIVGAGWELFWNFFPIYPFLRLIAWGMAKLLPNSTFWNGSQKIAYEWRKKAEDVEQTAESLGIKHDVEYKKSSFGKMVPLILLAIGIAYCFSISLLVGIISLFVGILIMQFAFARGAAKKIRKSMLGKIEESKYVAGGRCDQDKESIAKDKYIVEKLGGDVSDIEDDLKQKAYAELERIAEFESVLNNSLDIQRVEELKAKLDAITQSKSSSDAETARGLRTIKDEIDDLEKKVVAEAQQEMVKANADEENTE